MRATDIEEIMMERYVTIDKQCVKPSPLKSADGTIGMKDSNLLYDKTRSRAIQTYLSEEDGCKIWGVYSYPVPNAPDEIRINQAMGLTSSERWLCAVSGYGARKSSSRRMVGVIDYHGRLLHLNFHDV